MTSFGGQNSRVGELLPDPGLETSAGGRRFNLPSHLSCVCPGWEFPPGRLCFTRACGSEGDGGCVAVETTDEPLM